MSRPIMTATEDFRPTKPMSLKPNPKALKPQAGVLKATVDEKDSLVQVLEVIPPTKECRVCHRTLPATKEYFFGHPNYPDKLEMRCKECTKAYKKALRNSAVTAELPAPLHTDTADNKISLQQAAILERGAAIQQAVATAEVIAAVSLLLGMDRSMSDTVIRMVQAFYAKNGVQDASQG